VKSYGQERLILSLVLLGSFSISAHCSSHWDAFLERPDKNALVVLEIAIAPNAQLCSWGRPGNRDVAPTEKQDMRLFELIAKGNEPAFRAALLVSRCLDGGELEDFYRSGGMFFEAKPGAFLQIIKEKDISDLQLRDFLIMLPLDTVDHLDRQIHMIENRIALLKAVDESSLQEAKKRGLSFLEREKGDLNRIKTEMNKPR